MDQKLILCLIFVFCLDFCYSQFNLRSNDEDEGSDHNRPGLNFKVFQKHSENGPRRRHRLFGDRERSGPEKGIKGIVLRESQRVKDKVQQSANKIQETKEKLEDKDPVLFRNTRNKLRAVKNRKQDRMDHQAEDKTEQLVNKALDL